MKIKDLSNKKILFEAYSDDKQYRQGEFIIEVDNKSVVLLHYEEISGCEKCLIESVYPAFVEDFMTNSSMHWIKSKSCRKFDTSIWNSCLNVDVVILDKEKIFKYLI